MSYTKLKILSFSIIDSNEKVENVKKNIYQTTNLMFGCEKNLSNRHVSIKLCERKRKILIKFSIHFACASIDSLQFSQPFQYSNLNMHCYAAIYTHIRYSLIFLWFFSIQNNFSTEKLNQFKLCVRIKHIKYNTYSLQSTYLCIWLRA